MGSSIPEHRENSLLNRHEFENLRDLPDKTIEGDVKLTIKRQTSPWLSADDIRVSNSLNIDVRLTIQYNPEIGSKTFNAYLPGVGPICRLDLDGAPHRPCGRTHKHSLQTEKCPDRNLSSAVIDRADLSGLDLRSAFQAFCKMAGIEHRGTLISPEGT